MTKRHLNLLTNLSFCLVNKGVSHCLLSHKAQRRRTKAELQAARLMEQQREREIQAKLEVFEQQQR